MTLTVNHANPRGLLQEIKRKIDDGAVRTWAYNEKDHFTHTPPQWKEQAWLKPIIALGALQFEIVLPKGEVKQDVEGHYQGRFAAMLRNKFGYEVIETSTHEQAALSSRTTPSKRRRTESTGKRRTKNATPSRRTRTLGAGKVEPIAGRKR